MPMVMSDRHGETSAQLGGMAVDKPRESGYLCHCWWLSPCYSRLQPVAMNHCETFLPTTSLGHSSPSLLIIHHDNHRHYWPLLVTNIHHILHCSRTLISMYPSIIINPMISHDRKRWICLCTVILNSWLDCSPSIVYYSPLYKATQSSINHF